MPFVTISLKLKQCRTTAFPCPFHCSRHGVVDSFSAHSVDRIARHFVSVSKLIDINYVTGTLYRCTHCVVIVLTNEDQKYRTKEEVEEYKQRDPIQQVLNTILKNKFATQEELDAINKRVNETVVESVKFAEESPWPSDDEVLKDVVLDPNFQFVVD